ncbi:UDP-N-acetylglucosamine diphosphorylase [Neisseria macacae ATCC 33926]|uniref:UDP-N-acetylglucosamine diphosphorylase n=1 Tax=Neisseria macacae ATCC 33926 TaxID=997348 RepID=A0AA36XKS1_9NEIS|nr:UDP-N-acetylglucosamine diphosphorylase [Neisseria macacae ATCC 33926]
MAFGRKIHNSDDPLFQTTTEAEKTYVGRVCGNGVRISVILSPDVHKSKILPC